MCRHNYLRGTYKGEVKIGREGCPINEKGTGVSVSGVRGGGRQRHFLLIYPGILTPCNSR